MLDHLGRPTWDTYFMSMAYLVAQRSLDPRTKHGAVVVDRDHTILSVGYNGPPRGCQDQNVPLTSPEKYDWMVHAENAAIINAARHGISLLGSIFYVTGYPCPRCVGAIINVGASRVIYGGVQSVCVSQEDEQTIYNMLIGTQLQIAPCQNTQDIPCILQHTINYFEKKHKNEIREVE